LSVGECDLDPHHPRIILGFAAVAHTPYIMPMAPETPQRWTVLAGAGISIDAPACLPDGAALAGDVFDLLAGTGEVLLPQAEMAALRETVIERLRLEVFLEILAGEISAETVFGPFQLLAGAVPNVAHLALAALSPRALVTTNQDLLLEAAQRLLPHGGPEPPSVLHLHGRCDDIGSIITMISQYLGGLPSDIRSRFVAAVAGANVLVVGYSGRDRDVMPLLLEARPAFVRWILHTRLGASPEAALAGISPELAHARKILGPRLQICCADTTRWLMGLLGAARRDQIATLARELAPRPLTQPAAVDTAFRRIDMVTRNHALARLLEQVGDYRAALRLYETLVGRSVGASPALLLHLGRATVRVRGHESGRQVFLSLLGRRDLPPAIRAHALLNTIDTLRNTARPVEAMRGVAQLERLLERLELSKDYWQLTGWTGIARAGIDRIEGRAKSAYAQYTRAQQAFQRARDIDGVIDAGTWKAESALMLGRIREASSIADEALRDAAAYGKSLVRAWPRYVKGECLALAGDCEAGLRLAGEARTIFEAAGNIQGPLWSLILASDCLRGIDWRRAVPVLRQLKDRNEGRRLAQVTLRTALEQAEIARAAQSWGKAAQALSSVRAMLRDRTAFTRQPRLILAHALLVEAECTRARRRPDAIRLLRRAREAYRQLGAQAFVARAELGLVLAGAPESQRFRPRVARFREGFGAELVPRKRRGYVPVHFV
jgi:tetratricopeptide (TPR) repeat protein